MCEKKKHKNLEAHEETPTPFPPLQRHSPDHDQLICSERRLLRISIFFPSTEAFTTVRKKKSRHSPETVFAQQKLCPPLMDQLQICCVTWCSDGDCVAAGGALEAKGAS